MKTVIETQYWFDGINSSYQVTKEDFYNLYLSCYSGFKLVKYSDGSERTFNRIPN